MVAQEGEVAAAAAVLACLLSQSPTGNLEYEEGSTSTTNSQRTDWSPRLGPCHPSDLA